TLTSSLTTEDGRSLTEPVEVPLTVNPAWENWTTMLVVIAMSLLVVVGVARARRTGAATRAPAMRGPEDPAELARSGRSAPLGETSPPPTPGPPDTGTSTDHDTDEERPRAAGCAPSTSPGIAAPGCRPAGPGCCRPAC